MKTKLTLTIDETVVTIAKKYAKNNGKSLSALIENYLITLDSKEKTEDTISPRVLKLMGKINLPENFDYKKELTKIGRLIT